ncbi:MAG: type II secretion system protein [Planctomycetota bacterium]
MSSEFRRTKLSSQFVRPGFTLVELTGVLIILALVAAMVIPLVSGSNGTLSINVGGQTRSAEAIATETTMRAIRDAVVSSGSRTGLWADLGHVPNRLPRTIGQMFATDPPLSSTPPFNPVTAIGWRGPYLAQPTGIYPDVSAVHPSTGNTWSDDNFTSDYGATGDLTMIDAWGNPIVLQIEFDGNAATVTSAEAQAARLVSAGPNGTIDWVDSDLGPADYLTAIESQSIDDVVIYLGITQ